MTDNELKQQGYQFLGWVNDWIPVHYDKSGNETTDPEKQVFSGYKEQPEYNQCRNLNHELTKISKRRTGVERVYVCHECKIYWKVDSGG